MTAPMADEPGRRAGKTTEVTAPVSDSSEVVGGVALVALGLAVLGAVALALLSGAGSTAPVPEASPTPALPPEAPLRLELGAGAAPLRDPRAAVGRFTAWALGRQTRARTGFVVNLDGRAGVVLTAHQVFGTGGGLPRPLKPGELSAVAAPRLEIGEDSFQLGRALVLPRASAVYSFTDPARDLAAFVVDRPRPGFLLRSDRLVRDEPLVVLTWTGELYRARAEPQVTGARTYVFDGAVPPASATGAPVLDRQKRVVGIHVATFPRPRGVAGICTDSGLIRSTLLRALAPVFSKARELQRE